MAKKILLVGAGLTSSLIVSILKGSEKLFATAIEIHVWEKARGFGGRFSTSRSPGDSNCSADLGAQYLTRTVANAQSEPFFKKLLDNGLIRKFSTANIPGFSQKDNDEKENFVCTAGTGSIVKYFFNQGPELRTNFSRRVKSFKIEEGSHWIEVTAENETIAENFDIVISTMPVPQLLELENMDAIFNKYSDAKLKENLSTVSYTSRYALGLFFAEKVALVNGEHAINFIDNDPVIRYWTVEDAKRELGNTQCQSGNSKSASCIHTTVQFGAENVEKSVDEVKELLLSNISGKMKSIEGKNLDHAKCHKWRYSQVRKGYPGAPGFVVISQSPVILGAGDGFTTSGFEGCLLSAEKTVQYLIPLLS